MPYLENSGLKCELDASLLKTAQEKNESLIKVEERKKVLCDSPSLPFLTDIFSFKGKYSSFTSNKSFRTQHLIDRAITKPNQIV